MTDEARFWTLIESAWERLGRTPQALRRELVERDPAAEFSYPYGIDEWLEKFTDELRTLSLPLSADELVALDRVAERKLYDIDREDIHEVTDGSDDGFLYCRGFIVAVGEAYYEKVKADPGYALLDAEWEPMCYFFAHLHEERFGSWPQTGSGISRGTTSNPAGWA
jgi:hypothetical protein